MSKWKAATLGALAVAGALSLAPSAASAQPFAWGAGPVWGAPYDDWGWRRERNDFWPAAIMLGAVGGLIDAATGGYPYDVGYYPPPPLYSAYGYPYPATVSYGYEEPFYAAPDPLFVRERVVVRRPAYVRQVRVVERRRVAHPVRVVRRTRIVVHDRHPRIAHRTVTRVRYSRPAVTRRVAIHND